MAGYTLGSALSALPSREHYAEAETIAAGERLDLLAALIELVCLRELHRQAARVLRGPQAFVRTLERLPAPGDTEHWRREVLRRTAKAEQ